MAQDQEWLYYLAREMVSRSMAAKATNPAIGKIHEDLADSYAVKALQAKPVQRARKNLGLWASPPASASPAA